MPGAAEIVSKLDVRPTVSRAPGLVTEPGVGKALARRPSDRYRALPLPC